MLEAATAMSRLDRYVGRIVAGAFLAALAFFLFLTIVMDVLGNLPRYIHHAELRGITGFELAMSLGEYYLKLLPVMFVTIAPFVTVIACMFSLARIQNANEVVPMLFVGRPMRRILRPMMLCGMVAGLGMACCWQWVVPHLSATIAEGESVLNRGSYTQKHLVDESESEGVMRRLYAGEFNPRERSMVGVNMLIEAVLVADNLLVTADRALWRADKHDWLLENGWRESARSKVPLQWLGHPDLTPEMLLQRGRETIEVDTQSYTELAETMALRPNRADVRLALHRHITYPLANLILLMLALPLAVWFERGSRVERVIMAIGLCGLYALFDLICQSLGQQGHIHPVVAAWSPTIVFGSLGVVLYGGMKT